MSWLGFAVIVESGVAFPEDLQRNDGEWQLVVRMDSGSSIMEFF
jgi:hypothetical protein